ncbi:MAG: helix-turn-helix domain-containing protein [Acidobacteriia bacterium]|nr:helix-turn-helix domain-containing protein [Terriglobia bacterium]
MMHLIIEMNSPVDGQTGTRKSRLFLSDSPAFRPPATLIRSFAEMAAWTTSVAIPTQYHEYMTVREVVNMSGFNRRTIYRHVEKKLLVPCNSRGKRGQMRFRRIDVMRYLEGEHSPD